MLLLKSKIEGFNWVLSLENCSHLFARHREVHICNNNTVQTINNSIIQTYVLSYIQMLSNIHFILSQYSHVLHTFFNNTHIRYHVTYLWAQDMGLYSLRRHCLIIIGIPIINLRWSSDHVRLIMGIHIPIRQHLSSELSPWSVIGDLKLGLCSTLLCGTVQSHHETIKLLQNSHTIHS